MKIHRTIRRFWVDEKEAVDSSLRELGSGTILKDDVFKKLKKKLKQIEKKKKKK